MDDSGTSDRPGKTGTNSKTVRHRWNQSEEPSIQTLEAVAAVIDRPVTELPPLQESIDVEALDRLLTGQVSSVTVSFQYAETVVSVKGNGGIEVEVDGGHRWDDDG